MSDGIKIQLGPSGTISSILAVLAACLSYHTNHSVLWAIVHFICGIFYDVYWLFEYGHVLSKLGLG